MISIHQLTYNPFAENTYLLANEQGDAILIDPGMYVPQEQGHFLEYLNKEKIKIVQLVLTHAHIDHVLGLSWIKDQFDLEPSLHADDHFIYQNAASSAMMFGLELDPLPEVKLDLLEGKSLSLGKERLDIVHTPGHSPGSVSFISHEHRFIIGGDVLFQGSIGRTDLPGGNFDTLINSIRSQFLILADDYTVYSGHGATTTIGQERRANPFLT